MEQGEVTTIVRHSHTSCSQVRGSSSGSPDLPCVSALTSRGVLAAKGRKEGMQALPVTKLMGFNA